MSSASVRLRPAKLTKAQIAQEYTRRAGGYDFWGKLTESQAQARCLELANVRNGESVLEVAVGTGLTFSRLLQQNPDGWTEGIDLTATMLLEAQAKAAAARTRRYNLALGDAYALSYPDNSFDLLVNNYMFDLLPEADFLHVLGEFWRVLRPNGRLALINFAAGRRWYQHFWDFLSRLSETSMAGCRRVSLMAPVQAAGFTITHAEFISQNTFPSEVIVAVKSG